MAGEIFRVGDHAIGQTGCHPIGDFDHAIRHRVYPTLRQAKIAVVSQRHRTTEKPTTQSDAGCIQLEQVQAEKYLFLLSHLLLLAFVWRNRRIEAIQVVGIGVLWNLAAIAANGGFMPISPATLARINPGTTPDQWMISQHYAYSKNVILYRESANLWLLSDVIVLPAPFPWPVAFSLGDLFIAVGVMVLLQGPSSQPAAQPGWTFRENANLRALPTEGWQEEAKIHES